ncbi:laminin subunit beta-1-like isoform X2 [Protopterus annectens]|nr:laminin subunit beta-1-like isoform X2 [Protopterus annectens]
MAVYLATGNSSGGVCDDCMHNTMGRNCELCKPFYYHNPLVDIRAEGVCIQCDCDPDGSVDGGACDSFTNPNLGMIAGQCRCKSNVKGQRCDTCKEGFYGLSRNDPLGCQPCRCDPRGIVIGSTPCDHISGDCYCKRYVTSRYCSQCLPEYWGLSNDINGCRPCECDFGGAYHNRCLMENGQCVCRPNIIGRQCNDVQPGFFCMPLDYYTYEAENAVPHSPNDPELPGKPRPEAPIDCVEYFDGIENGQKVRIRRKSRISQIMKQRTLRQIRQLRQKPDVEILPREHTPDRMITWTGLGFARVKDGAGLVFHIDNIPYAMDYDIMIRYEPESSEDWEAIVSIAAVDLPTSPRCGNLLPTDPMFTETLSHRERYVVRRRPFCFEPNNRYTVSMRLQRFGVLNRHMTAYILIDSLVLLPRYTELIGFHGNDPIAVHHREEMERYMCLESFKMATMPALAQMCIQLICSISAIIHDGALPCQCDPQGSISGVCEKIGGHCTCKPNVIGRRCDQCAPGTYQFGPNGCIPCNCHPQGASNNFCDPNSGQCKCNHGVTGRQCDLCYPGQWGFPSCRPCLCNGHSEVCDPQTGECIGCRDFTTGRTCERCLDGYFGDPVLGSGKQCRPCPCPGYPGSGQYHGNTCHMDVESNLIVCQCVPGYTGSRCDRCAPGYYGNPELPGGICRPCQCSNNIDTSDPASCDPRSGQCLKCLYNTDGPHCEVCKPGYFGNALQHNCRRCTCNIRGTLQSHCTGEICYCDRVTGNCPCKANIIGRNCDQCAPHHWNFGQDLGCEPCACNPRQSLSSDCNMFTGQCHCRPGFGGRLCSACEEGYWGDPQVECKECSCHPEGTQTIQCNEQSGECLCREGIAGMHCDKCARGYHGTFPRCFPCHQCFTQWEQVILDLHRQLETLKKTMAEILENGLDLGVDNKRLKEIEDKLNEIQQQIGGVRDWNTTQSLEHVRKLADSLRVEVTQLLKRVEKQHRDMVHTNATNVMLGDRLHALEDELKVLNASAAQLKEQIEKQLPPGFQESFQSIEGSYGISVKAEEHANRTVFGQNSLVEQSRRTREETENLLKKKNDEFQKNMAAHKRSLTELENKTQQLNVAAINEAVCGSPGHHSCQNAQCGGANCRDDWGNRKCGGDGCTGALPVSMKALKSVQNTSKQLTETAEKLSNTERKIRLIYEEAEHAKMKAEETMNKAEVAKQKITDSTKELHDLIKKIKDFLNEEGADPESIELVARKVLNISLPYNAKDVEKIAKEIKDAIGNLNTVDQILKDTATHLTTAKDHLDGATKAQERAEKVNATAAETKIALDEAARKTEDAESSIKETQRIIKSTKNKLKQINDKIGNTEKKQKDIMNRLTKLAKDVQELKNKTEQNRVMAEEAKEKSDNASMMAKDLQTEMKEVEKTFDTLKSKVSDLDKHSGSALDRAKQIQAEAKELLKNARNNIRKLEALEKKFQENGMTMQTKVEELKQLEETVVGLLQYIRQEASVYSTCN